MRIRYKYYIDNIEVPKKVGIVATKVRLESVGRFDVPTSDKIKGFKTQVVINKSLTEAQYLLIDDNEGLIRLSETVINLLKAQRKVVKVLKELGVVVPTDTRKKRNVRP